MPLMPYPVTRPPSLLAIENLLNHVEGRKAVYAALLTHDDANHELAAHVLNVTHVGTPGRDPIEQAFRIIGQQAHHAGRFVESQDLEAGIAHLDKDWFGPPPAPPAEPFWYRWSGNVAPIVREGLIAGLQLAGYDPDAEHGVPVHLIWTCGSPTFEVASSPVRAAGEEDLAAVCIVISTPGTRQFLWHIGDRPERRPDIDDDLVLVGRFAQRNGDDIQQSDGLFVTGPAMGAAGQLARPARVVDDMVARGVPRPPVGPGEAN